MTVEEYIERHTKNCSNGIIQWEDTIHGCKYPEIVGFQPWLTPDHARSVAKIAKEETINKACEWLKENASKYIEIRDGQLIIKCSMLKDFRKAMEE